MDEMDEVTRAVGGNGIGDRLTLSAAAYRWFTREYNPDTVRQLEQAERSLLEMFGDQPVSVNTEFEPLDELTLPAGSGCVSVRGKEIVLSCPAILAELESSCNSIDITPFLNGDLELCFGFKGLIRTIAEE